ncbi:MAG: NAD(P)/FAD-dependent oxidoreductase [Methanobacteriota archaeon]|nr:MAG: NAD(P)/FAD-dependent oxidoreductase [Euryarchaeota archaeon]
MPSPYDVIVVGSGPAGGTAARYAARRGLKVLLVDKRKEIGVPVQCGEYVAHNEEIRSIFPDVEGLEDLMAVPYHVREVDTPVIRIWSPKGRRYEVPFKGFTVRRDRMDQGIAAQAVDEGAEIMTETTVVRVHGEEVATNHGTFQGKVVIGSDGPRSTVAKSVGLEWPVSAPAMSATADGDFSNSTDMFFGNLAPGGYAWIIPKAHCANVGLGTWQYFHGNLQSLFDRFVRSRGLEPGKATGGFVPVMGPPPRTVKDNAMLV